MLNLVHGVNSSTMDEPEGRGLCMICEDDTCNGIECAENRAAEAEAEAYLDQGE